MASCRTCNLRILVAVVCGLVTTIILGLGIWMAVLKIQRETSAPPGSFPIEFCRNGGTWENGRCICTEEWKGRRCTIANFCENSTYMDLTFPRIPVGRYGTSLQTCGEDTLNAGNPRAIRMCNITIYGEIQLQNVTRGRCDENLQTLENQIENITTESRSISIEVQILTSNASTLTADNITSATKVLGQIFNKSRNADAEAKKVAVTTVSQLLDAKKVLFQESAATDNDNALVTLIEQMEDYSLFLGSESVVEPNVAIQSVNLEEVGTTYVRFSVQKGTSESLVSSPTSIVTNVDRLDPDEKTELQILLNTNTGKKCGFVVYQNNKLFQSKTFTATSDYSQKIISSKVDENELDNSASVQMVFRPRYNQNELQLYSYACVFWNLLTKDWDTNGCYKNRSSEGLLGCHCNHTTNFAVLMTFKKYYQYPESLDMLSNFGCALSIAGLVLTIIFQIVTRKARKTSVTWVLVSLCTSMLIFNLLFVFGIENSNKNLNDNNTNVTSDDNEMLTKDTIELPNLLCTVVAALLHYFLLVTFMWNGLSATQLYFFLIRTMRPLPRHFIIFISLTGWGVPAIVVAVTVGVIYAQNKNGLLWELEYRQEEICWLAIPNSNNFIRSPFLWSFIMPVTIILISNIVIFIIISVKVLWKNNQTLTSTKKVSYVKKILSTLSIAIVFGITWILAYLMLINNDDIRLIFSYVFCLFNTTQGLQIFILYTVRTKIFQSKASKVLRSLSSSIGRVKPLPSMTPMRLRVRMYNMLRSFPHLQEHFRLLEPSVSMEEMTDSRSKEANSSM